MSGHKIVFGFCTDLPWAFPSSLFLSADLLVSMTVCVATQILSSSVEYLYARLYNFSIVAGGSKDSEWKKGVDGPKLLLKFQRTTSML